jgi:hypothetical protein
VDHRLVVVTAASSNHAGPLRKLLGSLERLDAQVECYDLGLAAREIDALPRWDGLSLRAFDYAAYPAHMNVEVNAGEYAWKPAIVSEVVERERTSGRPRDVVWADAGTYFDAIAPLAGEIRRSAGVWLRRSSGTVAQWTHPGMWQFLGEDPAPFAERANADATLVGFATGHPSATVRDGVYGDVIAPWKACAMARDCIAPPGSSRRNHRQDQAVLTYLVHKTGHRFADTTRDVLRVRCKCDRWFYRYIGFDVPASLYRRCCLY